MKSHFDTGDYGKKRKRALTNWVFYLIKTGCQWRFFLPPWKSVYRFYMQARQSGIWKKMIRALGEKSRINDGRNANTTIDLQSAKKNGQSCKSRD
ncbi:transposase [Holospora undulata]|uniref:transposase n=1 Tax=Holospora undulata TaxID=1169117 RepID=UPI0009DCE064